MLVQPIPLCPTAHTIGERESEKKLKQNFVSVNQLCSKESNPRNFNSLKIHHIEFS